MTTCQRWQGLCFLNFQNFDILATSYKTVQPKPLPFSVYLGLYSFKLLCEVLYLSKDNLPLCDL